MPSVASRPPTPLRWTRRFGLLALACVLLTAMLSATLLSRSMSERMLMRNAELAQEFIDSLLRMHQGYAYFTQPDLRNVQDFEALFGEVSRMPGLIHANVYNQGRRLIWSTNREAIGRTPGPNPELDEALAGELALESPLLSTANFIKPEHAFVPDAGRDAIETYIPVRDPRGAVVGVAELYMSPRALVTSVHEMTRAIWLACAGSGLFIFAALYGLVLQADRQLAQQQRRLLAQESLAAVGDMASAVAHGIRNPLAAIRSSAELMSTGPEGPQALDIMAEVDRLQGWVRKLLAYAQQGGRALAPVQFGGLAEAVLEHHAARLARQQVQVHKDWSAELPPILADAPALEQALDNLISNALDAMPGGGTLGVSAQVEARQLHAVISDTGTGIQAEELARVFLPFHTTKRTGLGVGLSLVKRTLERLGGRVDLESQPGRGTQAHLWLPLTPLKSLSA